MIDIKTSARTRTKYVNNIVATWDRATPDQLARGRNWYPVAHELASMLADGDVRMGAGVIAALSANKQWNENVRLANRAFITGRPSGTFGDALRKAARIMDGEDPADVLPMESKTGHFFRSIVDPTDPEAVCVDRHAHDIAVGVKYGNRDRGLGAKGRYELLAYCYRRAAKRLGETPLTVQAVTWTVQVDAFRYVRTAA